MDVAYDRGVASRARALLLDTQDPELRDVLKVVIKLFDGDVQQPAGASSSAQKGSGGHATDGFRA